MIGQPISIFLVDLVHLKMDVCLNVFGVDNGVDSFCTAIGEPCHLTFENCKDRNNYQKGTRIFKYSSAPVDFPGYRPYVKSVRRDPTEIFRDKTKSGRLYVAMNADTDKDIGLDPYYDLRAGHELVDYWPVFLSRNSFFENREICHYQFYEGQLEADIELKFSGQLKDYQVDGLGSPVWEAVDQLQGIGDIEVPSKLEADLAGEITDVSIEMTISNFDNVQTPAGGETLYVQCEDEIIGYTGTVPAQNTLTGLVRGAFGSIAIEHDAEVAVKNTRHYPPAKPYDIMENELLIKDAAVDPAFINSDDFTKYLEFPFEDINYSALILEGDSAKVRDLYFELVTLTYSRSWQGESGQIRIRRRLQNEPDQAYRKLRHQGNIGKNSLKQQNKTTARYTRTRLFWDKNILADMEEVKAYGRVTIGVDTQIEGPNGINRQKPFDVLDRWHWRGMETDENLSDYLRDAAGRMTWLQKFPPRVITINLNHKDSDIQTGDMIRLYTPRLRNSDGTPFDGEKFQVIKRQEQIGGIFVSLEEQPRVNVGFIAPDGTPDWPATEALKEYAFIWSDDLQQPVQNREYYII